MYELMVFFKSFTTTRKIRILNIVKIFPFKKAEPTNIIIEIIKFSNFFSFKYFNILKNSQGINAIANISGL